MTVCESDFFFQCIGDHHQLHVTSLESSKTKEGKIASADIVGPQQPNISTSDDNITSGSIQSNPAQQSTSEMDRKNTDCVYYGIALYNYEAQMPEDLTFQKGIPHLPSCLIQLSFQATSR